MRQAAARGRFGRAKAGADDRDRTGDLVLTKDVLCQLSYIGLLTLSRDPSAASVERSARFVRADTPVVDHRLRPAGDTPRRSTTPDATCHRRSLERETGIEPATNSLEGCDSTTELLPPTRSLTSPLCATAGKPARLHARNLPQRCSARAGVLPLRARPADAAASRCQASPSALASRSCLASRSALARILVRAGLPAVARGRVRPRAKAGGEGRIRTSEGRSRQIYSLLRLTASLPRRMSNAGRQGRQRSHVSAPTPESAADGWVRSVCVRIAPLASSLRTSLELAKGFEPPTG